MTLEEQEPIDSLTNGQVHLTLTITDEVTELGIATQLTDFDSEKSFVTEELAEHLLHEYDVDVREHGIEIRG